ncbi:MAG: hypothetical protein ACRD68_11700, partial [Pyrinomonadaceae bacterium]
MIEEKPAPAEGTPDEDGKVVYSRLGAAGADGGNSRGKGTVPRPVRRSLDSGALVRTLMPLLVGFALLIGLVIGLGVLSSRQLDTISRTSVEAERRQAAILNRLLTLRLALNRLNAEARIRAQVEAGTSGVMLPPFNLRLRNERTAVERLLPLYDQLPVAATERGRALRGKIVAFVETTKDLQRYSLEGFEAHAAADKELEAFFEDETRRREELAGQRDASLDAANREIKSLMWL